MEQLALIKNTLTQLKPELLQKYYVQSLGLFGSVVRDDFNPGSDIDIIVGFSKPVGIEFIDLANYIESKLQRKVDMVSRNGVKEKYYKAIEQERLFMSKREPEFLIQDMVESAHKILDYTASLDFESFTNDGKTIDATIRNFEIIGEAATRLPDDFRVIHSAIDWNRIRGFRKRIVHDYFGIDLSIVWQIKEMYLLTLIEELTRISSGLSEK